MFLDSCAYKYSSWISMCVYSRGLPHVHLGSEPHHCGLLEFWPERFGKLTFNDSCMCICISLTVESKFALPRLCMESCFHIFFSKIK